MKTLTSLLERLNLDPEVLEACARNAEALGIPLERALYEAERINENQYLETAAARHAMPCELRLAALMDKEGSGWATDAERVCKVPLPWLRKQKVVPVRDKDGKLALAICHPSGWLLAQELGMLLGERLERPVLAREDDITDIINRIFGESTRSEGSVSDVLGDSVNAIDEFNEDAVEDLLEDSSEAPFIRLVNMILAQAVRAGASDIHIEPYRDVSRVRFRLDGVLYERHTLNKAHHAAVVSRIKVMAKLNIAEKRLPQDGRIAISLGGRQAGLRVSTLPTSFGERVVLRLLEKSERVLSLTELGLSREDLQLMHSLVGITHGIVLVTGPTGSGKTTLVSLAARFYDATEGTVLVDGVDVRDYTYDALYDRIGYVTQKAILFSGDVRGNVLFGASRGKDSDADVQKALELAQASEFVDRMPGGIHAPIAEGGTNVSGGQKQRLSIARALARRPEILVFDDSFSALDYRTDTRLRAGLDRELKDTTRLIVAQRIGTIRNADKIIVLDEGRMVGMGTQLMQTCPIYQEIARSQLSQEELGA